MASIQGMKLLFSVAAGALAAPCAVHAQTLDQLACAAGVVCSGALAPDEARVALGMDSQTTAERAFIDASRDFPDEAWRCAASGQCTGSLTQNEARVAIPLPENGFAAAEALRRRGPGAAAPTPDPAPNRPTNTPSKPVVRADVADAAGAKAPSANRRPQGIEVEVNQPGPNEIDLQKPQPTPGGEIQPQDGTWRFVQGRSRLSGQCLPGLADALIQQLSAPQTGPVAFQRPFNASQIIRSPQVTWQRIAANHWRGTLAASKGQVMESGWTVRVTSPVRMEGESTVRVSIPSVCTISTPFTFERQ